LRALLEEQQKARRRRGERFVAVLVEAGALPQSAEIEDGGERQKSITRPYIADMLVEHGTVRDRAEAFELFLTESTDTFVPKPMPSGAEVIDAVHASGGIVSLAHPGHGVAHREVLSLIAEGLDAVEVVHPSHDRMLEAYYRELAEMHGLFATGGSDFHEEDGRSGRNLGRMGFRPDEKLLERLRTLPDL
jgi:predicted metal-dependent phosphoesterase TrpH